MANLEAKLEALYQVPGAADGLMLETTTPVARCLPGSGARWHASERGDRKEPAATWAAREAGTVRRACAPFASVRPREPSVSAGDVRAPCIGPKSGPGTGSSVTVLGRNCSGRPVRARPLEGNVGRQKQTLQHFFSSIEKESSATFLEPNPGLEYGSLAAVQRATTR